MKFKKRRLVSAACLAVCVIAASMPATLAADVQMLTQNAIITPYMTYISDSSCALTIGGGKASVTASVYGYLGQATKCSVSVDLQEQIGTGWKTIGTWSNSKDGDRVSTSGIKAVTKGKTYRVKAIMTVWAGAASESKTVLTNSKTA